MCGIFFTNSNASLEKLNQSMVILSKRGPDSQSYLKFDNVYLAHTRLAIVDKNNNKSDQPMIGSDRETIISFNGEIYNYKELRKKYSIVTKTESDTEVLLELIIKFGPKILRELNGMFAFVVFNKKTKKIIAARDRLGIKPLYFSIKNENFYFSSLLSVILKFLEKVEFDEIGIRQARKLRNFFQGHTFYKDISEFPPGHYFNGKSFIKYWDIDEIENDSSLNKEEIKELIIDSVKIRVPDNQSFSTLLSGGVDSSIITKISNPNYTYCVGSENNNEFSEAQEFAKNFFQKE